MQGPVSLAQAKENYQTFLSELEATIESIKGKLNKTQMTMINVHIKTANEFLAKHPNTTVQEIKTRQEELDKFCRPHIDKAKK